MLTPMQLQYLVGLCCLKTHPDSVDIVIGDMVYDNAAKKKRDVDVTVLAKDDKGEILAFKAYEVKHESKPLDTPDVEQLVLKLNDMKDISYRAVVSGSGYTDGAKNKAAFHGIDLLEFQPWTENNQCNFKVLNTYKHPSELFRNFKILLCWNNYSFYLHVPSGPNKFNYSFENNLYNKNGKLHPKFRTFEDFCNHKLQKSTDILFKIPINQAISSQTNLSQHTHTLCVTNDRVFINLSDNLHLVEELSISGELNWQTTEIKTEYILLVNSVTKEVFTGTAILPYETVDNKMAVLIMEPNSENIKIHHINLLEKHTNLIKNLKL
jgi:hypothetical protein